MWPTLMFCVTPSKGRGKGKFDTPCIRSHSTNNCRFPTRCTRQKGSCTTCFRFLAMCLDHYSNDRRKDTKNRITIKVLHSPHSYFGLWPAFFVCFRAGFTTALALFGFGAFMVANGDIKVSFPFLSFPSPWYWICLIYLSQGETRFCRVVKLCFTF